MKRPAMAAWGLLLPTAWCWEHTVGHCRNSHFQHYNDFIHTSKKCWSFSNKIKETAKVFKNCCQTKLLSDFQSTRMRGRLQTEIIERLSISLAGRRTHGNIILTSKEAVGGRYLF